MEVRAIRNIEIGEVGHNNSGVTERQPVGTDRNFVMHTSRSYSQDPSEDRKFRHCITLTVSARGKCSSANAAEADLERRCTRPHDPVDQQLDGVRCPRRNCGSVMFEADNMSVYYCTVRSVMCCCMYLARESSSRQEARRRDQPELQRYCHATQLPPARVARPAERPQCIHDYNALKTRTRKYVA